MVDAQQIEDDEVTAADAEEIEIDAPFDAAVYVAVQERPTLEVRCGNCENVIERYSFERWRALDHRRNAEGVRVCSVCKEENAIGVPTGRARLVMEGE